VIGATATGFIPSRAAMRSLIGGIARGRDRASRRRRTRFARRTEQVGIRLGLGDADGERRGCGKPSGAPNRRATRSARPRGRPSGVLLRAHELLRDVRASTASTSRDHSNADAASRFASRLEEMSPAMRALILTETMARRGLLRWCHVGAS